MMWIRGISGDISAPSRRGQDTLCHTGEANQGENWRNDAWGKLALFLREYRVQWSCGGSTTLRAPSFRPRGRGGGGNTPPPRTPWEICRCSSVGRANGLFPRNCRRFNSGQRRQPSLTASFCSKGHGAPASPAERRWANPNKEVQQTNENDSGDARLLFLAVLCCQIAPADTRRKPDPPRAANKTRIRGKPGRHRHPTAVVHVWI